MLSKQSKEMIDNAVRCTKIFDNLISMIENKVDINEISNSVNSIDSNDCKFILKHIFYGGYKEFKNMILYNSQNNNIGGDTMPKSFDYETYSNYLKNKMTKVVFNGTEHEIYIDTLPLLELVPDEKGMLTEEETIKYIYNNNLFDEAEKLIKKIFI